MLRALLRPRPVSFAAAASPALRAPAARSFFACAPLVRCAALPSPPLLRAPPSLAGARGVRHGSRKAGALGVKTKSAIKKRFRVSGGGTIRRLQGGKRHLSLHKSSARIRRLGARVEIKAKGILRRYTKALSLSPLARLK